MPDAPHTPPDPVDTVDRCAQLSALLDDPFADRAAVLRGAGLDEERWAALQERWAVTLAAAEGNALVARYGEVYEATLRRLASGGAPAAPPPDTDGEGPRFLTKEEQPWRAEAAAVQASGTGDAPTLRSPSSMPPPASPPLAAPAAQPLDGTAPLGTRAPGPALPFAPPSRATSPASDTLPMGERSPFAVTPFEKP